MQKFKSVYFSDYPSENARKRNVKLAFGSSDQDVFSTVTTQSSSEIRSLLGHNYAELKQQAETKKVSFNAHCIQILRATIPSSAQAFNVDPIQTTFRGGGEEPLHGWYPYLEGYSPEFVTSVIDAFAPDAKRILDPFGGTGTTPLTAAKSGVESLYCELNPLLQHLISAKSDALSTNESLRSAIADELKELADGLPKLVRGLRPDTHLEVTYLDTFRSSVFFPPDTFETLLRLRTWLDELNSSTPLLGKFATVAVVSALIPCSNLIRRGDLRFRKGSETELIVKNPVALVQENIGRIALDIEKLKTPPHKAVFIAADAKRLDRIAPLNLDAVITSPPYLNGTNYYRNTKLELWFLRSLTNASDLTNFRYQTVTAGINDVTRNKSTDAILDSVKRVSKRLAKESYDSRISKMVASYFNEMDQVFDGLATHLKPNKPLAIDIGDSAYSGIHVDTPSILSELLAAKGWSIEAEVNLRSRQSRSGQTLRQALLVARSPATRVRSRVSKATSKQWEKFKTDLPHQSGVYAKRNWGSSLHSICSYQGKMKPALAHHVVKSFIGQGDRLLDPFGGVGTIAFEAAQLGAETWSFDISPAAAPIARAKLSIIDPARCDIVVAKLSEFIKKKRVKKTERADAEAIKFNGKLSAYFHPETFDEILLARRFFSTADMSDPSTATVFSCLLHILHGNRPYALSRRSHPITPFAPTGEAESKSLIAHLQNKLNRVLCGERSSKFVAGNVIEQDATGCWPIDVDNLNAVITSPPFFDSTRFYLANWMRLWFSGWSQNDFSERPRSFVDERQKQSFKVYEPIIRQARERLKPGGVCVFHLGKSRKCDMAIEVEKIAKPWFKNSEIFTESVNHCESHGIRDKGTVADHTYLVLR